MASSESTLVERVQNLVSEHKRVIICTAAVALALGGVAYYVSTTRGPGDTDSEKGGRKAKDKRRSPKGSKKRRSVKDEDGPILEERTPKVPEETIGEFTFLFGGDT
jgi:import receptor subunit TOM70